MCFLNKIVTIFVSIYLMLIFSSCAASIPKHEGYRSGKINYPDEFVVRMVNTFKKTPPGIVFMEPVEWNSLMEESMKVNGLMANI